MSKMKKIVTSIIIGIAMILGINIISNAYSVGQILVVNENIFLANRDMFCAQEQQRIDPFNINYRIISQVVIEGKKSTDNQGRTTENNANAKLAAILHGDNGRDANWNEKFNGPVSKSIWNYLSTWLRDVGEPAHGINRAFASTDNRGPSPLDDESTEYVASINNMKIEDRTQKDKITSRLIERNSKQYVRVGPFNWTFPENASFNEIKIYDQKGDLPSEVLYSTYRGNDEVFLGGDKLESGKDFYISIPASDGITKITKIEAKIVYQLKSVKISFLESMTNAYQNLIIREPYTKTEELKLEMPYDIEIFGSLKIIKVDQDNPNIKLEGVGFKIHNARGEYVKEVNGKITYVSGIANGTEFFTDRNGEINIRNLLVGTYTVRETKPIHGYKIVTNNLQQKITGDTTSNLTIPNKKMIGNLKVIKVDADNNEVRLQNVGFYIQYKETGEYVKVDANGKVSYVSNRNEATEFITDRNGEINIKDLWVGTYIAYETRNPNYGYEISSEGQEKNVVVDKTADFEIENKRKYIKLSGYVWVDVDFGKDSIRNDLFKDNTLDNKDILFDGIKVRLKDKSGKIIDEAITANGGAYQFVDVLLEELGNYYMEFEYDGLTYTNVIPHIDKDNGSKSAENERVRADFNNKFAVVNGETRDTGYTTDTNGNRQHELKYFVDESSSPTTSSLINSENYIITANTDETGYSIKAHYVPGQEEIKHINLGLYRREQVLISLREDLSNVRLEVNGKGHTYHYAQDLNGRDYMEGLFNVGVKFGPTYDGTTSYTAPVYRSDYEYTSDNKTQELKVYVTYQINARNIPSDLNVRVNSIINYYDSRYTLVEVGTGIERNSENRVTGNITGIIPSSKYTDSSYNAEYKRLVIDQEISANNENPDSIYVRFELGREAVLDILNDGAVLRNISEINSYSTFDRDGKIYASIDKMSNPGNAVPGERRTYENDTDTARDLKLEVTDARELTGKVFLDGTSPVMQTGMVRQGDGKYEDGELGIEGVKISLSENSSAGKVYETETNENGDFFISGFIPGDYTLTYTWGNETYTVQNYKGTVYDSSRNQNDTKWYKVDVDTRYTDAIDRYEERLEIDEELKSVTSSSETTIGTMNSDTPTMDIGVEYESVYTASFGNKYTYQIKNIDFGIVERAKQDLDLSKRVSTVKLTLANGQVITNITIDEEGNIVGENNHLTYMGPNSIGNGFVKIELDNELIQGAVLEVTYEIKANNSSELDYLSENFYKYGIVEGNVVTIKPSAIVDYLDNSWAFESSKNTQWEIKNLNEMNDVLTEEVINSESIKNKMILYTEFLSNKDLKPGESESIAVNVSKMLTTTEDVEINNEAEIAKVDKTGGSSLQSTPGNYIPGEGSTESDDAVAETVIITPPTGEDRNYMTLILIGTTTLAILAAGVVIIKKKVMK